MKIKKETVVNKPGTADDKRLHLELIQQVIARMGGNLFYLRGWSITLAAGLLALLSQKSLDPNNDTKITIFPLVMLGVVVLIFWVYDGYFLAQERRYRKLYDKIRVTDEKDIDYSMDASEFSSEKKCTVVYCMLSKTLWPFYSFFIIATTYLIVTAVQ